MLLFLSFAAEDSEVAEKIALWFSARDVRVCSRRGTHSDDSTVTGDFESKIGQADAFISVMSPDYLASASCRRERVVALHREPPDVAGHRRFIYVLEVRESLFHDAGELTARQWTDMTTGRDTDDVLSRMLVELRAPEDAPSPPKARRGARAAAVPQSGRGTRPGDRRPDQSGRGPLLDGDSTAAARQELVPRPHQHQPREQHSEPAVDGEAGRRAGKASPRPRERWRHPRDAARHQQLRSNGFKQPHTAHRAPHQSGQAPPLPAGQRRTARCPDGQNAAPVPQPDTRQHRGSAGRERLVRPRRREPGGGLGGSQPQAATAEAQADRIQGRDHRPGAARDGQPHADHAWRRRTAPPRTARGPAQRRAPGAALQLPELDPRSELGPHGTPRGGAPVRPAHAAVYRPGTLLPPAACSALVPRPPRSSAAA